MTGWRPRRTRPLVVDALANDLEFDLEILVIESTTQPAHGAVEIAAGGRFVTYRPAEDFAGTDQFDYVVSDGRGGTDTATVIVTVNTPPTAFNYEFDRPHGSMGVFTIAAPGVLDRFQDDEGDLLTPSLVSDPSQGAVVIRQDGSFTYTPTTPGGRVMPDLFTYRLHDGHSFGNVATVRIHVPNVPPTADDVDLEFPHGTRGPVHGQFAAHDGDVTPDPLSFKLVTEPLHGKVDFLSNGRFAYSQRREYIHWAEGTFQQENVLRGPDRFTYRVNDGYADSNVATVEIAVGNLAPVANAFGGSDQFVLPEARLFEFDPVTLDFVAPVRLSGAQIVTDSDIVPEGVVTPATGHLIVDLDAVANRLSYRLSVFDIRNVFLVTLRLAQPAPTVPTWPSCIRPKRRAAPERDFS